MTDKYITHAEAVRAKVEGKEVQVLIGDQWLPAIWAAFDCPTQRFRLKPTPPRVAREWWIQPHNDSFDYAIPYQESGCIHVSEVLPDDPTVREEMRVAGKLCDGREFVAYIKFGTVALHHDLFGNGEVKS